MELKNRSNYIHSYKFDSDEVKFVTIILRRKTLVHELFHLLRKVSYLNNSCYCSLSTYTLVLRVHMSMMICFFVKSS